MGEGGLGDRGEAVTPPRLALSLPPGPADPRGPAPGRNLDKSCNNLSTRPAARKQATRPAATGPGAVGARIRVARACIIEDCEKAAAAPAAPALELHRAWPGMARHSTSRGKQRLLGGACLCKLLVPPPLITTLSNPAACQPHSPLRYSMSATTATAAAARRFAVRVSLCF